MPSSDLEKNNAIATQLAGAAVSHFFYDDRDAVLRCLGMIPDPPGVSIGLLRFASLAVAELAARDGSDPGVVARELVGRVVGLREDDE